MSVVASILQWGSGLPAWQQHAISVLFAQGSLSANDDEEVYALLKAGHGIADPHKRAAQKIDVAKAAPVEQAKSLVQITAIKNLRNVNALAENQTLPISATGLTVIYGDNGSGKSGYSRVLKRACRARDQGELILPDASAPLRPEAKAQATFDLLIDSVVSEANWVDGTPAPEALASISVFDTRCARAYVDDQDDFSYVPYGMDILRGLADLCTWLKKKLEDEVTRTTPNTLALAKLSQSLTPAGRLVAGLSARTKPDDVEKLSNLLPENVDRHAMLAKSLKANNPKEKAQQLRTLANRLLRLAERCTEKWNVVNDVKTGNLKILIDASNTAKKTAEEAARTFRAETGRLPGTGGDVWQELFAAAKKFAVESHAGKVFPHLAPDDQCPLCQQPLNDAAARLVEFDTFIQNELEKIARESREKAVQAYKPIKDSDLGIGFDLETQNELKETNAELAQKCLDFEASLKSRQAEIFLAAKVDGDWTSIGNEPADPAPLLTALNKTLIESADAMEKAADERNRQAMQNEFNELDARIQLRDLKDVALQAIQSHMVIQNLNKCLTAVRTNSITSKSTEINEQVISKELADALTNEYKKLNVSSLKVSLKPLSQRGKTNYKLVLETAGGKKLSDILSEGEQRAIAIGSFLAEVNIGQHPGGVIFDDPMSSLDHRRREKVASRLIEEAQKRQVIIFTHDLYFLCMLQQEAQNQGVPLAARSLHKTVDGFGVASEDLPFDGTPTKTRIGRLRVLHSECDVLHRKGDEQAYIPKARETYRQLRIAWERAIEEVLLHGTINRFGEGVSTLKLREVSVEDEDYFAIENGMSRCSKFAAHDGAAMAQVATPEPDELKVDIEALETWRANVENRKKEIGKRRKK